MRHKVQGARNKVQERKSKNQNTNFTKPSHRNMQQETINKKL
jgi:hypothetical protein